MGGGGRETIVKRAIQLIDSLGLLRRGEYIYDRNRKAKIDRAIRWSWLKVEILHYSAETWPW